MTAISLKRIFVITFVLLKTVSISAELIRTSDGKKYNVILVPKYNWMRAVHACSRSSGGELLTFNSKREYDEIVEILKANFASVPDLWLGGNDRFKNETDFHRRWWSVGGKCLNFFAWNKNEPNNYQNKENCMVMAGSQNNFLWFDDDCGTQRGYICDLNIERYQYLECSQPKTMFWDNMRSWFQKQFMNMS